MSDVTETSDNTVAASNTSATDKPPVLEVVDLKKHFPVKKGIFQTTVGQVFAVDGVSFTINEGETLGLVGESGCGKSTVGRALMRLIEPTSGTIKLDGRDVTNLSKRELRPFRREMQIIFQDPFSSLDPRMTAGKIVGEPLSVHGIGDSRDERREMVAELFERVGLRKGQMDNFPHQFSGGQRQRIGIARALALNPKLIVGDEPVSALDVSIQAQIIRLLEDLRQEFGLTYLFIGHDLSVVRHMCDRVAIMYLGKFVEIGDSDVVFSDPKHPYTQALLEAVPVPDPDLEAQRGHDFVAGEVPSPRNPPPGCAFHPRCSMAQDSCRIETPIANTLPDGRRVACPHV